MIVDAQMIQAIEAVKSAAASMKIFSMQTQDQQAKEIFDQLAKTLDKSAEILQERQQYVEEREPQLDGDII